MASLRIGSITPKSCENMCLMPELFKFYETRVLEGSKMEVVSEGAVLHATASAADFSRTQPLLPLMEESHTLHASRL